MYTWYRAWKDEVRAHANKTTKRDPNLLRVLLKTFGYEYLRVGFIFAILEVLLRKIGQPVLLWQLIRYFSTKTDEYYRESSYWQIYLYATAIVGTSLSVVVHFHPNFFTCRIVSMRMRIALTSLIYKKVHRLLKDQIFKTRILINN